MSLSSSHVFTAPLVQIAVCLFLVHYHPEPVDGELPLSMHGVFKIAIDMANVFPRPTDCPCFEDAIAILSVVLGSNLSYWWNERYRPDLIYGFPPHVSPFGLSGTARLAALALMAVLKVAIGEYDKSLSCPSDSPNPQLTFSTCPLSLLVIQKPCQASVSCSSGASS